MRFRSIIFLASLITVLGIIGVMADMTAATPLSRESVSRRAKARYYFLEGAEASAEGRLADAYTYYKKAYESDTTYEEAANALGTLRVSVFPRGESDRTIREWEEAIKLCRRFIDNYPSDYSQIRLYAQLLMNNPLEDFDGQPSAREAVRVLERLDSLGSGQAYHLIDLSNAYSALEMPDSVLGALSRYERREGTSFELLENKVGLLFKSGVTQRAAEELNSYRESHPRDERALQLMSMLKYMSGDIDSTYYYMYEAEKLNPLSFDTKSTLALFALQQQDTLLFRSKAIEALELPDGDVNTKTDFFKNYLSQSDYQTNPEELSKVRELISSLHSQFPQESSLYLIEGGVESSVGRPEVGEELIRRGVALDSDNTIARGMLVQNLLVQKRPEDALCEISKVWEEIGPDQNMRSLAVALAIDRKKYDLALHFLTTSLREILPGTDLNSPLTLEDERLKSLNYNQFMDLASIFQETGDVYAATKRYGDVDKYYDKVLLLVPNAPMALNNYAYYLSLDGRDLDRALEMSERSLRLDPGNPTFMDTKAWILFKMDKVEEARQVMEEIIAELEQYIQENPQEQTSKEEESEDLRIHYGAILWKSGLKDEAFTQWRKVLEFNPDNEEVPILLKEGWNK